MATTTQTSGIRLEPALPGRYYCDPAILEQERERIFRRSWIYIGREDRWRGPGDFLTLEVHGESVLVLRDREGGLRAFYNVCRHRGSRLCAADEGSARSSFQCPYHAWTYGLDGRLLGAPNLKESEGFCKEDFSLAPVDLETWRGFVFIRLEGGGVPLATRLGGIPGRARPYPLENLKVERRTVHEVEANWKILFENYQECYHCPGTHPELCDLVPLYGTGEVDIVGGEVVARFREGASTLTHDGRSRRPMLTGLGDEQRAFNGESILPNMWINFLPDFLQTRVLWPLSPTRTRIVTEWLFEGSTMARPDFDASDVFEFTMLISRQDWAICEAVQKGVGSRSFRQGVLVPLEEYVADFDRWVLEQLGDRRES